MGIAGHVKVYFLVSKQGKVKKYEIKESVPPGVFDQAVLDVVKKYEFEPFESDFGAEQEFEFQLKDE